MAKGIFPRTAEHNAHIALASTKHGMYGTATYKAWADMKQRCSNQHRKQYADWGGRGITVCERWQSFENFLEDMGERPDNMTLDRINNDGNYEIGNCRWATKKEQAQNRRKRKPRG